MFGSRGVTQTFCGFAKPMMFSRTSLIGLVFDAEGNSVVGKAKHWAWKCFVLHLLETVLTGRTR